MAYFIFQQSNYDQVFLLNFRVYSLAPASLAGAGTIQFYVFGCCLARSPNESMLESTRWFDALLA